MTAPHITTPMLKQQLDQLGDILGDDGPVLNIDIVEVYPSMKRLHAVLADWISTVEKTPTAEPRTIRVSTKVEEIQRGPISIRGETPA